MSHAVAPSPAAKAAVKGATAGDGRLTLCTSVDRAAMSRILSKRARGRHGRGKVSYIPSTAATMPPFQRQVASTS